MKFAYLPYALSNQSECVSVCDRDGETEEGERERDIYIEIWKDPNKDARDIFPFLALGERERERKTHARFKWNLEKQAKPASPPTKVQLLGSDDD